MFSPFGLSSSFGFGSLSPFGSMSIQSMLNDMDRFQQHVALHTPQSIAIDVHELPDKFALSASVPGFTRDQIKVEVDEIHNLITISAQKKDEKEKNGDEGGVRVIRKERSTSLTERRFYLPKNVDTTKIASSLADGILHIDLPKAVPASSTPRQIHIA